MNYILREEYFMQIKSEFDINNRNFTLSVSVVKKRFTELWSHMPISDAECSGWRLEVVALEKIEGIYNLMFTIAYQG